MNIMNQSISILTMAVCWSVMTYATASLGDTENDSVASQAAGMTAGSSVNYSAASILHDDAMLARLQNKESASNAIHELTRRASQSQIVGVDQLTSCPQTPPDGIAGVTNKHFYFLSEILPEGIAADSPACGQALACFLNNIVAHQVDASNPPSPHSNATLVIDRQCVVNQTLTLPNRFTLAGVGKEGEGALLFQLPDEATALRFSPNKGATARYSTIRDLKIANTKCCGQIGIDVSNSSLAKIEDIRLFGFGFGIYGSTAFSILVKDSSLHENGINLFIGKNSTSWRVRDTTINQASLVGVILAENARGNLISGAGIESNAISGIDIRGMQNVIENSWFEGNGIGFGDHGIRVSPAADQIRILGNLFSSEDILDNGSDTQMCFNTDDNAATNYNNCLIDFEQD